MQVLALPMTTSPSLATTTKRDILGRRYAFEKGLPKHSPARKRSMIFGTKFKLLKAHVSI